VSKCASIAASGRPCKGLVRPGNDYCTAHDPSRSEQRKRAASKAGSSKAGSEIHGVKRQLKELVDGVIEGTYDKSRASVAFQGLGILCRVIELERKVKETDELAARLEALEARLEPGGGSRRWGS
jgi:hypothetical protein